MKRVLLILFIALSFSVAAQTKPVADTSKLFYLVMPAPNWEALLTLIKTADEKPSVINQWLQIIAGNVKELPPQTNKK